MKPITKEEDKLISSWILENKKMVEDQTAQRINWLINSSLQKISKDETGWITLDKDSNDGRFWELTYPDSEMNGGGAPMLSHISDETVKKKYSLG